MYSVDHIQYCADLLTEDAHIPRHRKHPKQCGTLQKKLASATLLFVQRLEKIRRDSATHSKTLTTYNCRRSPDNYSTTTIPPMEFYWLITAALQIINPNLDGN